jgi:hypothetical protein
MNGTHMIMIAGVFNGLFAVFHLFFWKMFKWPESLASSGPINRKIMPIFNIVTTSTLFVFSGVCLFMSADLVATPMGQIFCLTIAGFWGVRTITEIIYGDMRDSVSQTLVVLFALIAALAALPVLIHP